LTEAARDRWKALAAMSFGAAMLGIGPVLVRMTTAGPAAGAFWRIVFALPFMAILCQRANGSLGRPKSLALAAGLLFALDLGFWHYGVKNTSVTNATVLGNLTPLFVVLFAWVFLRQKPRAMFVAALAAAMCGAWLMAADKGGGGGINPPLGDLLSLTAAFWYAGYLVAIGIGRRSESATRLMFWSGMVSAPVLLGASLMLGEPLLPVRAAGWAACVGLGIMHVIGQGSIAWAMGRLPTSLTSVVVLLQSVVAAFMGWTVFHEAIGPVQAVGVAILLAAIVGAQAIPPRKAVVSA
jgi:drug/metabolite transporter (DMT)-like permease